MPTRKAHARWEGSLQQGKGAIDLGSGAFRGAYSFRSRFEGGPDTNPEELLGAAHAGCFAMALSLVLGETGFTPDYLDVTAEVTLLPDGKGYKITRSQLKCEGRVPRIDRATFMQHADTAKTNCPVSQALAGVEISLEATLLAP